jgi:hypothetical protein
VSRAYLPWRDARVSGPAAVGGRGRAADPGAGSGRRRRRERIRGGRNPSFGRRRRRRGRSRRRWEGQSGQANESMVCVGGEPRGFGWRSWREPSRADPSRADMSWLWAQVKSAMVELALGPLQSPRCVHRLVRSVTCAPHRGRVSWAGPLLPGCCQRARFFSSFPGLWLSR